MQCSNVSNQSSLFYSLPKDNLTWICGWPELLNEEQIENLTIEINQHLRLDTLRIVCLKPECSGLSSASGIAILNAFKNHPSIGELCLQGNKGMGDEIAPAVKELLIKTKSLRILNLTNCGISSRGAVIIAQGLKQNKTLTHLQIYQQNSIQERSKDQSMDSEEFDVVCSQGEIHLGIAALQRSREERRLEIT